MTHNENDCPTYRDVSELRADWQRLERKYDYVREYGAPNQVISQIRKDRDAADERYRAACQLWLASNRVR